MIVLYEDNHLLVIEKPINIPMQEDSSKDMDVLSLAKAYLKDKYQKPGNVYCGLVHRLDRPVGGVVVLAKTSKAASRLSDSIRTHQFIKTYHAIIDGVLPLTPTLTDYLLKDSSSNTSSISTPELGKFCELSFDVIDEIKGLHLIKIHLKTGRSHQIRVQFASRKAYLYGDQRYNPHAKVGQQIALWASHVSLIHPTTQERMDFSLPFPNTHPWTLFKRKD